MCKPLDSDPPCSSNSGASACLKPPPATTSKRVRFEDDRNVVQIERIEDEQERHSIWYNRQDFYDIRAEIGQVVQARAARDWRCKDDNKFYCVRGLEFLKQDEHTPSRKERRLCFVKNVMVFQCLGKQSTKNFSALAKEQALSAYCCRLSRDAKLRAQNLASLDETEARQVYHECRLIYQDLHTGKEVKMFAPTCSLQASTFNQQPQQQQQHCEDNDELVDTRSSLQDVFSLDSLIRVISTVRNTSILFAAAS